MSEAHSTPPVSPAAVPDVTALALADELRAALDDPKRYEWGNGPWEHLGDAERDVRKLLDLVDALLALVEQTRQERDDIDEGRYDALELLSYAERERDAAQEREHELVERANDLVEVVALQEKAQRGGYWNQHHATAVAASSMRLESALARAALAAADTPQPDRTANDTA